MIEPLRNAARAELARRHFTAFQQRMDPTYERARHLDLLAEHLEAIERRDIDNLIVAMPPRHGKSRGLAQDFPAWAIGRNPKCQIIIASYGAALAEQHSRRAREICNDERYPFDVQIDDASRAADRWATTRGGLVRAAGIGGSLTGFGADFLLVDDAVADLEAAESALIRESTWGWWSTVARTRLMPKAAQIVCGTRWHEDDLIGRIMSSPGASRWTLLILPAIAEDNDLLGREPGEALWPERYPVSSYPSVADGEMSSRQFEALYQQRPAPAAGALFKRSWFEHRSAGGIPRNVIHTRLNAYTSVDSPSPVAVVIAVDAAAKTGIHNDYSAIATIACDASGYYIVDIIRERLEFADLLRRIEEANAKWAPSHVFIEEASSGIPIVQELKRATRLPVVGVPPKGSKIARAESVTPWFESGNVRLPHTAPWIATFVDEICAFPVGRNDDMVDAVVLGLQMSDRVYESSEALRHTNNELRPLWMER